MDDVIFENAIKKCEENKKYHNKLSLIIGGLLVVWIFVLFSLLMEITRAGEAGNNAVYILPVLWSSVFFILIGLYRMHVRLSERQQVYSVGFIRAQVSILGFDSSLHESMATALSESAFSEPEKNIKVQGNKKGVAEGHPVNDLTMTVFNRLMDNFELQIKQNKGEKKP